MGAPAPGASGGSPRRRRPGISSVPRVAADRVLRVRMLRRGRSRSRAAALLGAALLVVVVTLLAASQVALAVLDASLGRFPDQNALEADTLVYDRGGALIAQLHPPGETRVPVPLSAVAALVQQATVDIEDRNFWHEGAVDAGRIVGAAWDDVAHHGQLQGASTITEQLAKVLYLDTSRTLDRKVRELFLARHLDSTLSKSQILEDYLNDIYYGHGATGIAAASQVYFGIPPAQLDLAQASLLAALPNHPADLDPLSGGYDLARHRQLEVLDAMVDAGDLTIPQRTAAFAERLDFAAGHYPDNLNRYPMLSLRIAAEISSRLHVDPLRAGLRVVTSIVPSLQDRAQSIVTQQVAGLRYNDVSDGALVAVDPQSGEVVAWVGSAGPGRPGADIDMAAAPRQPGSTFKLFTYSTALGEKKVTMETPVLDGPLSFPTGGGPNGTQPYQVMDYDLRYHGVLPVAQALGNSLNIPAMKVEALAGIPNVLRTARAMGVTTLDHPDTYFGRSLTLGTYPVPLYQMAQAGAVIADGGQLRPAHLVVSAKDASGRELLPAPATRQAIDPGVAYIMNAILTDDSNRVMEFGSHSALTLNGHLVAAKTGTTQDFRDNLTVGWTPHLSVAVWVGNADDHPMVGTTGITGAAPIWHAMMAAAVPPGPEGWAPPPADVHPGYGFGRRGWFLAGTGPSTLAGGLGTGDVRRSGGCRYWSFDGGQYWWCGSGLSSLPGDPGPVDTTTALPAPWPFSSLPTAPPSPSPGFFQPPRPGGRGRRGG